MKGAGFTELQDKPVHSWVSQGAGSVHGRGTSTTACKFFMGSGSWGIREIPQKCLLDGIFLAWLHELEQKSQLVPETRGRRQVIIFFPRRSEAQMGSASIYQTDLHLPACHSPVLLLSQGSASSQTYPKPSKPMAMSSSDLRDRVSSHSQGRGGCAGGGNPAAMEFTSFLWCLIFVICKAIS